VDIQALCRPLEQMEQTLGALYEEFARVFARDEEAAELFGRLAREEKAHYSMIQFEKRLLKQNPGLAWELKLGLEAISDVVREAEEMRRRASKLSLEEATKGALAFESSDAENHCRDLGSKAPPEVTRLLQSLRAGDRAHHEALERFAKSRGFLKDERKR